MWIVSWMWNGRTYSESYNTQAEAIDIMYMLRRQGKDATLHFKDFK